MGIWRRISDGAIFLSTRPVDGEWETQDEPLEIDEISTSGRFQLSEPVTVAVPVEVEVDLDEAAVASPTPRPLPEALSDAETQIDGPCCEVEGMADSSQAQRDVVTDMRQVIDFALETYGLTHAGHITIHISHSASGLFARYEEVFGHRAGGTAG